MPSYLAAGRCKPVLLVYTTLKGQPQGQEVYQEENQEATAKYLYWFRAKPGNPACLL